MSTASSRSTRWTCARRRSSGSGSGSRDPRSGQRCDQLSAAAAHRMAGKGMDNERVRRHRPVYAVVFKTASTMDQMLAYRPLIDADEVRSQASGVTWPHGLDREIFPALPALRYCLHLPRTALDVAVPSAQAVRAAQLVGIPHRIWLVPPDALAWAAADRAGFPALALCPDDL